MVSGAVVLASDEVQSMSTDQLRETLIEMLHMMEGSDETRAEQIPMGASGDESEHLCSRARWAH